MRALHEEKVRIMFDLLCIKTMSSAMVTIEFKIVTDTGINHPSNFSATLPDWTGMWDIYGIIAKEFYQIPSDIAVYRTTEDAGKDERIPLDDTLSDIGISGGDALNPPTECLWVVSRHDRFGYSDPLGSGTGL